MSTSEPASAPATVPTPPLMQLRWLTALSPITIILAIVLAVIALNIDTTEFSLYGNGIDEGAVAGVAALNAWSNILLIVGITTGVGAIVLAGVRELLNRASQNV
ncbi:hypothetical protein [Microbacterium sp.]|uniref:hypothetical protein n=1 Tax=Microbacterium sp. TaxID=51671 RepID=UPI003A95B90A